MIDTNKNPKEAVQIASIDVSHSNQGRLWRMLDDIDSLGDAIKPVDLDGYKAFFTAAIDFANKRHLILKSDGYELFDVNCKFIDDKFLQQESFKGAEACVASLDATEASYFVMFTTDSGSVDSFLVSNDSASKAWDEAVEHIESTVNETAVITKFFRV